MTLTNEIFPCIMVHEQRSLPSTAGTGVPELSEHLPGQEHRDKQDLPFFTSELSVTSHCKKKIR